MLAQLSECVFNRAGTVGAGRARLELLNLTASLDPFGQRHSLGFFFKMTFILINRGGNPLNPAVPV